MDIETTIIWTFKNRICELIKSLDTANRTCSPVVQFYLVDGGTNYSGLQSLKDWIKSNLDKRKIHLCESPNGTSICEGWNLGMYLCNTRYVIFVSSDVEFRSGGWEEEIECWFKGGKEYILLENHAVFGFDKAAIPKMGWFDENFVSGPHFDCDFMIRASEANVQIQCSQNYHYYYHADTKEETADRLTKTCPDRLPMNSFENERYFMSKWNSNWPGWEPSIRAGIYNPLPHPPTSIGQAKRLIQEVDHHPMWTKKMKEMYGRN